MSSDLFERRPLIVVVLVTLLFFWKLVFTNQFTFLDSPDLAYQVLPWYQVQARAWNEGKFPMWDPYQWAGQPLLGQMQPGAAFPLNWPLFMAPLHDGYVHLGYIHWHYVLMHILAGLFMYALVRQLGRSRYAAVIAGVAFTCAGYVGSIGWPQMLHGAIWTPLIFLLFHRMAAATSRLEPAGYAVLCGGAVGMSLLSGHHQTPLFALLALTGLFLHQLWERKRQSRRQAVRFAALYGVVAVVAILVSALQLLPAVEYGRDAYRWVGAGEPLTSDIDVPYYVHHETNLAPVSLLGAVIPRAAHSQVNTFVGFVCLTMALYGVALCWRRRWVRIYACVGLGALVYSFGPFSILHGWLYTFVPYMDKARSASHAVFVAQFAVFVLAAYGIDNLFAPARDERDFPRYLVYAERGLVALGLLGWVLVFGRFVEGKLRETPGDQVMVASLAAIVLAALLHGFRRGLLPTRAARLGLLLLMVFEMSTTNSWDILHRAHPRRESLLEQLSAYTEVMTFLKGQPRPFRFEMFKDGRSLNLGAWEGVEASDGYLASVSRDLYDFVGRDWVAHKLMLNTVYTVSKEQRRPEQIEVFRDRNGWKVFSNPDAYPRAWVVHDLTNIAAPEGTNEPPPRPETCDAEEPVTFEALSLQRTRALLDLACRGYVIFGDPHLPGWEATVDGRPVTVYRAHGALRAVAVEAGTHSVEFVYRPAAVYWGGFLTALGLSVCFIMTAVLWQRGSRPPMEGDLSESSSYGDPDLQDAGAIAARQEMPADVTSTKGN